MERLGFFLFLVMQTTLMGWGLFFVAGVGVFLLAMGERRPWFIVLPLLWILPLIVSAMAHERGVKSADWTAYVALLALAGFVAASMALLMDRTRPRGASLTWIGVNTPLVLLSAFVTGMAAGGTWL